ncbi:MAG: hypothetical protein H6907_12905 [Hyphomicrobiales bacterium]|nr:hypothetical protein [Hyphomicrobiales bacterium]
MSDSLDRLFATNGVTGRVGHQTDEPRMYGHAFTATMAGGPGCEGVPSDALEALISRELAGEVGTAIAFLLPLVRDVFGPDLKLIHLRRDKDTCVRSLVAHAHIRPEVFVGFTDWDAEAENTPPTAVSVGEMDEATWTALPIKDKMGWHYDHFHRVVESHRHLFRDVLDVRTEDLNDPATMTRIRHFIDPAWESDVTAAYLNRADMVNFLDFEPKQAMLFNHLFRNYDWNRACRDPLYAFSFFPRRVIFGCRSVETLRGETETTRLFKRELLAVAEDIVKLLNDPNPKEST